MSKYLLACMGFNLRILDFSRAFLLYTASSLSSLRNRAIALIENPKDVYKNNK